MRPDLTVLDGDRRTVAITKRAIAALGSATITPASISAKAWEIDETDGETRGVSTFTLRNDDECRALLDAYRTFKAARPRRRAGSVPAHIASMHKAALIDALTADRRRAMRAETALDLLRARLERHGRDADRAALDHIADERRSLRANRPPGHVSVHLLERAREDHDRSVRLVRSALVRLSGRSDFTRADVLREARASDDEGRGLHADIFERNADCAELLRSAKGRGAVPTSAPQPKNLLRLDNHQLGLALACERRYLRALEQAIARRADMAIDLEMAAVMEGTVLQERRYIREQAELQRDLEILGLG